VEVESLVEILFVDDSVQDGRRQNMSKIVAIAGALLDEVALMPVQQLVNEIRSSCERRIPEEDQRKALTVISGMSLPMHGSRLSPQTCQEAIDVSL